MFITQAKDSIEDSLAVLEARVPKLNPSSFQWVFFSSGPGLGGSETAENLTL